MRKLKFIFLENFKFIQSFHARNRRLRDTREYEGSNTEKESYQ